MNWLADECVDARLAERLHTVGHDVSYIPQIRSGASDKQVLRLASREKRLLLTEDKDFGDLVFHGLNVVPGLVLLRLDPEKHSLKWTRLEAAIEHFGERLFGRSVHRNRTGALPFTPTAEIRRE